MIQGRLFAGRSLPWSFLQMASSLPFWRLAVTLVELGDHARLAFHDPDGEVEMD